MNDNNNREQEAQGAQPLTNGQEESGKNTQAGTGSEQPDAYRENEKIYTQNQGGGLFGVVGAAGDPEDLQPALRKEEEDEPDYRVDRDDFENYKDSERGSTDENRKRNY